MSRQQPDRLDADQLASALARLPDWRERLGALRTVYVAPDVATALSLIAGIGAAAETLDHHPDLDWRYRHVFLRTTTHEAGQELTERDVRLATEISALASAVGVRAEPALSRTIEIGIDTGDPELIVATSDPVNSSSSPADRVAVAWSAGSWLNTPETSVDGDDLLVTAADGSDFWRTTSYGFVRDSGHALLRPLDVGTAVEVSFAATFDRLYDQAGLLVRVDENTWIKAGIEVSDGELQLGAVATRGVSDWSMAPVPSWAGRAVTIRASRVADAVALRARVDAEPWQLLRLCPLDPEVAALAGPFCCAPSRAGLQVRFTGWRTGPADLDLHDPGL